MSKKLAIFATFDANLQLNYKMSKKSLNLATIIASAALLICQAVSAEGVDSLFVDSRGSFKAVKAGEQHSTVLAPEYFNIHIFGTINEQFSYRVRQRLNVPIDSSNPFRATDWMCLNWRPNDKLKLYAGKTAIMIGGYEYDSAPTDVYFYSLFNNGFSQYFAFSVGGEYAVAPGQVLAVQLCNSPLTSSFNENYAYNFAWIGHFAPWWNTIWTYNIVDDPRGNKMQYIALGNHCVWGPLAVDLDIYNRADYRQANYFLSDYSIITKLIYRLGNWNLCAKLGYEHNDMDNVDENGNAFDSIVAPGTDYWYGGWGVEYFPLGNERIRLHLAGFTDNITRGYTITTGVKWRFDIIKI